ncbi:MAG: TolC family protein [Planctomycetes bacterium]|nr:TolC family protein [Planctomycetota bacterium]
MAGCGIPEFRPKPELAALAAKTREIETVQLAQQSKSPPVSIEEATRELTKEVTEPNRPRPMVKLSLPEVRAAALENNLGLKVELVEPAIAQQDVDAARAQFESVFRASASYSRTELEGNGAVSSRAFAPSLEVPLQTGGAITTSLPVADTDGVAEAAASVSVIQSLLRGAGTQYNTYALQIAGYNKGSVDAGTKLRVIGILAQADSAYWNLYAARVQLAVNREQYKLTENQVRTTRIKVAAGSAAKIEIVRAEAGLSGALDGVIIAETSVRDLERNLKQIMNRPDLPLNSPVDINTVTDPNPKGLDLDPEALVKVALENRMEMADLEFQLAIRDLRIAQAKNGLLPQLDLNYRYTAGGQAGDVGGAFDDLFREPTQDHRVGLSATIPLGNRAAEAQYRRARLEKVQAELSRQDLERQIRQEVYDEVYGLQQSWRRLLAAEQGIARAYRDYRAEQSEFQLGRRTSTEVLFAASQLASAQSRRINAFVGYEITQVRLARATGTLLGRANVRLEPAVLEGK